MTRNIAFILFDGAEELDFAGPWEVLKVLGVLKPGEVNVYSASESGGVVACANGMRVLPDYSFATCPKPDIILVPGGQGTVKESQNPVMLDFVRCHAATGELATSVCTGSFVLAAAGLLDGKRATTYWASRPRLRKLFPAVEVLDTERWVDEGAVITASGVSAGIDMALHLVGRLWSPEAARKVQLAIEYFPEPPYEDVPLPEGLE